MQIAYGTKILLKNSNLDGNLKLTLRDAVPAQREEALAAAVVAMNTLGRILELASAEGPVELRPASLTAYADLYAEARRALARVFSALPKDEQAKYYGFARELKEYEDRVAKGDSIEY